MRKERVAELLNDMSPAQAADILAILPAAGADDLLRLINKDSASKVQQIIDEHDENILLYAAQRYIKLPPGDTGQGCDVRFSRAGAKQGRDHVRLRDRRD